MKRIKTLLIAVLIIAMLFSLFGCKMLPWGDSAAEETTTIAALPGWLTLAHRAEATEEPEAEEGEAGTEEEETEIPAATQSAAEQPATTQPAATQPAQQTQQPAQQNGTPRWQQPGTMEYLAKMRLDEMVTEYRRLKNNGVKADAEGNSDQIKMANLSRDIPEVAKGLGLDLKSVYGIDVSGADNALNSGSWFHDMDSPSGWGS